MIMILDVDVTAERRHYNTYRPQGDTATLGAKGPVKLKNLKNLRGAAPSTLTPKVCPRAVNPIKKRAALRPFFRYNREKRREGMNHDI